MKKLFACLGIVAALFSTATVNGFYNFNVAPKVLESYQQNYPYITQRDIEIQEILRMDLSRPLPGISFYQVNLWISDPPKQTVVSLVDEELLQFPYDFNKLLTTEWLKITPENAVELAYSFALLTDPEAIPYLELDRSSINVSETNQIIEKIEFTTYSRLGGIVKKWEFVVREGQFMEVDETVSEKRIGNYIMPDEDYNSFWRTPGIPRVYFLRLYETSAQGKALPPKWTFSVDKHYVTIRDNGAETSAAERTVTFSAADLDSAEVCSLRITSFNGATGDFLSAVATADNDGNWQYVWTPSGGAGQASDIARVEIKRGANWYTLPDIAEGHWALQDKRSASDPFNVDPDYALSVFYCTGYENYTGSNPASFSQAVWDAVVATYNKQVTEWGFRRPYDGDNNYHIYINDGSNEFHNTDDNEAWSGDQRKIGARCNSFGDHNYSSVQARVNAAVSHEFAHGIQYTYAQNHGLIWGGEGKWVREGQARSIPGIIYEAEEFARIEHFYPTDANNYLRDYLNTSLRSQSYRYCVYWRNLYENYRAGTQTQKMQAFHNALIETAKQDSLGKNAVEGGELAMNAALAASGGIYTSFDNSIDSFAIANALIKQYYEPDSLYTRPRVTNDPDDNGITATFSGTKIEQTDSIPQPFGIDYLVFNFSADGRFIKLCFFADPDSDNTHPDFHVQLILKKGADIRRYSFKIDAATDKGDLTFLKKDNDTLWVVVTRLDITETLKAGDNSYKLTLSYPIACTDVGWDNIQAILNGMGPGYRYENILNENLANAGFPLYPYNLIFINCSGLADSYAAGAASRLNNWVRKGGYIYASDWAYSYITNAFPGAITFPANPKIGYAPQYVNAAVLDPGLASLLGPILSIYYDLGSWVVADGAGAGTRTLLYGTYKVYKEYKSTSSLVNRHKASPKDEDWEWRSGPLMLAFDRDSGSVIYTTFHNEPQVTPAQLQMIRYMIIKPLAEDMLDEALAHVESGWTLLLEIVEALSLSSKDNTYTFDIHNPSPCSLTAVLNWGFGEGSILALDVYEPGGSLYGSWQTDSPPIEVNIAPADSGTWSFTVRAVDIAFENYPFVFVLGSNETFPGTPVVLAAEDSVTAIPEDTVQVNFTLLNATYDDTFYVQLKDANGWADCDTTPFLVALEAGQDTSFSTNVIIPVAKTFYNDIVTLEAYSVKSPAFKGSATTVINLWQPRDILLVADDGNEEWSYYLELYRAALDSLGMVYNTYIVPWDEPGPKTSIIDLHRTIIWFTGYESYIFAAEDTVNLKNFLDNGGNLFLTGNDVAYSLYWYYPPSLLSNYFHANYVQDYVYLYGVNSVPGTFFEDLGHIDIGGWGDADEVDPIAPAYAVAVYDTTDTLWKSPGKDNPAIESVLRDGEREIATLGGFGIDSSGTAALAYDGTYKLVFFAFEFGDIESLAKQVEVMETILDWFNVIAPPALIYPPNDTTIEDTLLTLDWSDVTGANYYHLQLADNINFISPVIDDSLVTESHYDTPALADEATYYWHVRVNKTAKSWSDWTNVWHFAVSTTGVVEKPDIPKVFTLAQSRPNPFSRQTTILYGVPTKSRVTLKVYNFAGQLVRTLVNGEQPPGVHRVYWDGKDDGGKVVATGIYFVRMEAGDFTKTKKLVLMR